MVSYTNTLELGESQSLTMAAGWQGAHDEYEQRLQAAISYNVSAIGLNYAFTTGDVGIHTAESHIFSASYGSWGKGLYLAGVYSMGEYMIDDLAETNAMEFLAGYALSNGVNLSVNYEAVTDEVKDSTVYATSAIQAEYKFTLSLLLSQVTSSVWTVPRKTTTSGNWAYVTTCNLTGFLSGHA